MFLPEPGSTAAEQRIALEFSVIPFWVIEGVMQAAAFFSAQRRVNNQRRYRCEIAQLQQID